MSTSVYCKKTHTDQYLHFSSHHPLAHKRAVVNTLFSRASRLSSSLVEKSAEEEHLHGALESNGYPSYLLRRQNVSRRVMGENQRTEPAATVTLPYIQGVSDSVKRVLNSVNIRVAFRPPSSLRELLSHPKDPIPLEHKCNVVYKIPCDSCDKCYVGQTGRTFSQRLREHQRAVRTFDVNASVLAEHVLNEDHRIAWEDVSILDQHSLLMSRLFVESWYISKTPNTLNREKGPLSEQYAGLCP